MNGPSGALLGSLLRLLALLVLAVTSLAGVSGRDDRPFVVPDGLSVALWAESPALYNPTALDVDARGRVWVTEAVDYRRWGGRNPGLERRGGDRVVILEDTDGDGVADRTRIFVQEEDLVAPLGIAVLGDKVYVSCSPWILVYTDADGDDVPERREVLLEGFGGRDHDHGLHSLVFGPDGRFTFAVGNAGPHLVTDRSGWTLRSGNLPIGGGPTRDDNKPGLVSADGRVWTGGLVLSLEPDGTGLDVRAHNFRNNYEVAVDAFGELWQSDNDDDGNASCRTLQVMEGGNHGYFSADGARHWTWDRRPGQTTEAAHWHQDDPGVVPCGTINGAGGPTGVAVYEGELLAPWIDGAVLNADAGRGVVYAHAPLRDGAGYRLEGQVLLSARQDADEDEQLFRPSDVAVGVDGALYVADWYDPGVGGHLARDEACYGRILRIAPAGQRPVVPELDLVSDAGRVAALLSPAVHVRALGWRALADAGAEALPALRALAAREDRRARARALWLLARLDGGRADVERALADPDPALRVTALRALARSGDDDARLALCERLAADRDASVRCAVALVLAKLSPERRLPALLALAEALEPADRFALEAFGLAAEGVEDELFTALAEARGADALAWDPLVAALAWRLHPPSAVPGLAARAGARSLSLEARRRALDALAFRPEREAAEHVAALALTGPEDGRELARFWLANRDTNLWRGYGLWRELGTRSIDDAELLWQSGIRRAGTVAFDVDVTGTDTLWLVVTEGENGNGHDWADWIAPRLVGDDGREVALTELGWSEDEAGWGDTYVDRNAVGEALAVDGEAVPAGIGTHAYSEVRFDLDRGWSRLVGRAGPDDGGARQPGAETELEFRVYGRRPEDPARLAGLEQTLHDAASPPAERRAAAEALASDPGGGMRLVRAAARGTLDDEARALVAGAIFQNPDLSVRALASEHFRRPGEEARAFPPIAELVGLAGDARRGRELFTSERAQCSACHAFTLSGVTTGRAIGPELTHVREKYGRAELFDAILNPSAAIAFGYDTWMLEGADGRLYSGFLVADGDPIVLKDTQGVRHVLPAADVAERVRQDVSTMPEGVALGLEASDLADLVAFLAHDPEAPPTFGAPVTLFDGESLAGWTVLGAEPDASPWSVQEGVLVCRGQPVGYLRTESDWTSFELTLSWRFDPRKGPGNSGVLLRMTGEDRVWPRSIEAQLHSGDAGDVWNIDAFPMTVDPLRTDGRRTVRLQPSSERPLGEWNRYRILLDGGSLRLFVNDVLQNTAEWCAETPGKICLQSEGAWIEFRDVVLRPIE